MIEASKLQTTTVGNKNVIILNSGLMLCVKKGYQYQKGVLQMHFTY